MAVKSVVTISIHDNGSVDVDVKGAQFLALGKFESFLPLIYRRIGEAKAQYMKMQDKIAKARSQKEAQVAR